MREYNPTKREQEFIPTKNPDATVRVCQRAIKLNY